MKISKLEAFRLRGHALLKLSTDEGAIGWGEADLITPEAFAKAEAVLRGQDPSAYDVLTRKLAGDPVQAAANMALLDLAGKAAKIPVFQLLGGPTRNKVRALARVQNANDIEALMKDGHRAFLLPVALPTSITSRPKTNEGIANSFAELRKRFGEKFDFVPDGRNSLPSAEASDLAFALESLRPMWFNEPCRESSGDVLRRISSESSTPLGLGTGMVEASGAQNLLRDGVVDVLRLSLGKLGITPIRRAAALAETYYVAVAPAHSSGGPIATAAALHLAASLPNFFIQEIPTPTGEAKQRRAEITGAAIEKVTDGYMSLSTKPGLGIEVNENALRRML